MDWGERRRAGQRVAIASNKLNFDKFDEILLNFNRFFLNFDGILKSGPDLSSIPAV
jgi:hypothetical protein